jgi:hypothetical protein
MIIDADWLIIQSLMVAVGVVGNSYAHYARLRGWPAGRLFTGGPEDNFTFINASVLLVPIAVGFTWYRYGLWYGVGVLVAGWTIAWLATISLRQHVQVFWFLAFGVVIAWSLFLRFG